MTTPWFSLVTSGSLFFFETQLSILNILTIFKLKSRSRSSLATATLKSNIFCTPESAETIFLYDYYFGSSKGFQQNFNFIFANSERICITMCGTKSWNFVPSFSRRSSEKRNKKFVTMPKLFFGQKLRKEWVRKVWNEIKM